VFFIVYLYIAKLLYIYNHVKLYKNRLCVRKASWQGISPLLINYYDNRINYQSLISFIFEKTLAQ